MLRHNTLNYPQSSNSFLPHFPLSPSQPPRKVAPDQIYTDKQIFPSHQPHLLIAQLNCFNGKLITQNILADDKFSILILQEPWIDTRTLRLPSHPAWHDFTPYDYKAKDYSEKPRTGIYVTKRIPSWLITALPSRSALLTAIDIKLPLGKLSQLRVISSYNPPTHNTGLPVLKDWLDAHNDRKTGTIIGMDGNLHHPKWNPPNYHHTHSRAKELIKICASAGFQITSQKNVPTFYPRAPNARPTTLDLTWTNFVLSKYPVKSITSSMNHGSDHQLLCTAIQLDEPLPDRVHNNARFETLAKASFCEDLENRLSPFPSVLRSVDDIDMGVTFLTNSITGAFQSQGKQVKSNTHRHKAWWEEAKLRPIITQRNRARRWMVLSGSREAKDCY